MEVKDIKEALQPMIDSLKKEAAESNQKHEDAVKQLQEDLTKSGATIGDIQKAVDTLNEAVNDVKAKAGRIQANTEATKSFNTLIAEAVLENKDQFTKSNDGRGISFEVKDVADMTTSTHHTGNVAITQANNVQPRGMYRHLQGNVLSTVNIDTLQYDYFREVVPAGEGSFGPQTEGSAKTQVDYDTLMISLTLDYEAGYATVTRQMLKNVRTLQAILSRNLPEDFQRRLDVKALNALASAATAASTSETDTAAKLIDYIVQVDNAGYGANGIVTTGAGWAAILKTKPNDYSVPGGVVISPSGDVMIAGLPVFRIQGVTSGKVYVADWTKAYFVQGESFSIRSSEHHSDNFTKNKVTFLAEAPVGLAIEAPTAFVYGNF